MFHFTNDAFSTLIQFIFKVEWSSFLFVLASSLREMTIFRGLLLAIFAFSLSSLAKGKKFELHPYQLIYHLISPTQRPRFPEQIIPAIQKFSTGRISETSKIWDMDSRWEHCS